MVSQKQRSYTFLFYDINRLNFFKYTPTLLEELSKDASIKVVLCYEEDTKDAKALEFLNRFENISVGLFKSIKSVVRKHKPDIVVVNAQRIPDSLLVAYANKRNIPTVMIQHGMYNGHLKRVNELYIRKLYKTFKYILYSMQVGLVTKRNPITTALKFIKTFSLRQSYKDLFEDNELIYSQNVHVYGNYWVDYHTSFFGYSADRSKFEVVGYPELSRKLSDEKINFCYIAQSLYEDGRITTQELGKALTILKTLSKEASLVVKRHPRSIDKLYEDFDLPITNSMPDADVYIGHYSSLLALPMALGKKVGLIPLEGHDIPDYFEMCGHMTSTADELTALLHGDFDAKDINQVFEFPKSSKEYKELLLSIISNE